MGNAEYMGSRPESDVSGGDIMGENEDLMLGEEELSEDDEGQMLEGPLLPGQAPMVIPEVPMPQEVTDGVDGYFCKHYKRKCMFVTPCCNGLYRCRFCHDEAEDHTLTREDVVTVECCDCKVRQGVNENCINCGLKFGQYFCFDCKLYDDEDKQQFHCTGCGICRVVAGRTTSTVAPATCACPTTSTRRTNVLRRSPGQTALSAWRTSTPAESRLRFPHATTSFTRHALMTC